MNNQLVRNAFTSFQSLAPWALLSEAAPEQNECMLGLPMTLISYWSKSRVSNILSTCNLANWKAPWLRGSSWIQHTFAPRDRGWRWVDSRSTDGKGASSSIRSTCTPRPDGSLKSLDVRRACRSKNILPEQSIVTSVSPSPYLSSITGLKALPMPNYSHPAETARGCLSPIFGAAITRGLRKVRCCYRLRIWK